MPSSDRSLLSYLTNAIARLTGRRGSEHVGHSADAFPPAASEGHPASPVRPPTAGRRAGRQDRDAATMSLRDADAIIRANDTAKNCLATTEALLDRFSAEHDSPLYAALLAHAAYEEAVLTAQGPAYGAAWKVALTHRDEVTLAMGYPLIDISGLPTNASLSDAVHAVVSINDEYGAHLHAGVTRRRFSFRNSAARSEARSAVESLGLDNVVFTGGHSPGSIGK